MPIDIDLVRHAETRANAALLWQGHGDTPLTPRGELQARRVRDRLRPRSYAIAVTSDLGRAEATAALLDVALVAPDRAWREANVGRWEGLSHVEVAARFPEEVAALEAGEGVAFGGGETYEELVTRSQAALDDLVSRLDDGSRAVVVTHGGVISAIVAGVLDMDRNARRRTLAGPANTSVTTIRVDEDGHRLAVLNDVAHLNGAGPRRGPLFTLIRHAETDANAAGRWQGATDSELTEVGRRQTEDAATSYDGFAAVYSSPLRRAAVTAAAIALHHDIPHHEHPGLGEIRFGAWEDQPPEAIAARWPEEWRRVYVDGEDLPRGGTGETYGAAAARLAVVLAEIGARHPEGGVGVVSHGGVIRAYVMGLLGLSFAARRRVHSLRNTASCRILLGERGPRLVDYNVAPHLPG